MLKELLRMQGLSYLSEVRQGPVEFGKKTHLDYQNLENLMQSKRNILPFSSKYEIAV